MIKDSEKAMHGSRHETCVHAVAAENLRTFNHPFKLHYRYMETSRLFQKLLCIWNAESAAK